MFTEPDFVPGLTYPEYVRASRDEERQPWLDHIQAAGPWVSFLTLTFKDELVPEQADKKWKYFVRALNQDALGSHYVNKVGHSFFGYVRGLEYQRRGVVHFHALVGRRIDYDMAHRMWQHIAGFLWISTIKDQKAALMYVTKYATKGGEIDFYKPKKDWQFNPRPFWDTTTFNEKQPEFLQLDFLE